MVPVMTISSARLNALLRVHLHPINLVVSQGSVIPNLEAGFVLRCFQRLSLPDIATLRCRWHDSRYTRGLFIPVLSSRTPLFLMAQTISSPVFHLESEGVGVLWCLCF